MAFLVRGYTHWDTGARPAARFKRPTKALQDALAQAVREFRLCAKKEPCQARAASPQRCKGKLSARLASRVLPSRWMLTAPRRVRTVWNLASRV